MERGDDANGEKEKKIRRDDIDEDDDDEEAGGQGGRRNVQLRGRSAVGAALRAAARTSLCEQESRPGVNEPRNPNGRLKGNAKDASIRGASC